MALTISEFADHVAETYDLLTVAEVDGDAGVAVIGYDGDENRTEAIDQEQELLRYVRDGMLGMSVSVVESRADGDHHDFETEFREVA